MSSEVVFRVLAAFIFVVANFVWGREFRKVGVKKETVYTAEEGALAGLPARLLTLVAMVGVVVYVVAPALLSWASLPLPGWLRWLGLPFGVAYLGLMGWMLRAIGPNYSMTLAIKEGHRLVMTGPYAWVRHPMYVALLSGWVAHFLITANWLIGAAGIGGTLWLIVVRSGREEQMMMDHFGDAYREYRLQTGAYVPRWRGVLGMARGRDSSLRGLRSE